ncbi:MAG TPA: hypothetical protein VHB50_15740 [Bryobacteraceae bacterium]|nr:hypothetical protein [Bryobacteraceae bacterium]
MRDTFTDRLRKTLLEAQQKAAASEGRDYSALLEFRRALDVFSGWIMPSTLPHPDHDRNRIMRFPISAPRH